MTAQEKQLRALSDKLTAAQSQPWQPSVVLRTMEARGYQVEDWPIPAITMQTWLALERIKSPFISGEFAHDRAAYVAEVLMALRVLSGCNIDATVFFDTCAAAIDDVAAIIKTAVADANATMLDMRPPLEKGTPYRDGFGWWAPLYGYLRRSMTRAEALATPLAEAWMLWAVYLRDHGYREVGTTYAQRDWSAFESPDFPESPESPDTQRGKASRNPTRK